MTIDIVNYGMGNLRSVQNAFTFLGVECKVVDSPEEIAASRRLLLPGVGSFARAMETITARGYDRAIHEAVDAGAALLGICLGMQLLASEGEEDGRTPGLGFIPGRVRRMQPVGGLKVPHVGFNTLRCKADHGGLFGGLEEERNFYFLHAFTVRPEDGGMVIGTTTHGDEFVCALRRDRVVGVQFHPEKSQSNGLRLLRNFVDCF